MKNNITVLSLLIFFYSQNLIAQLTPQQASEQMVRGINIGNTFDGGGNQPFHTYAFDDYKAAGFNSMRISITWNNYLGTVSPYQVQKAWMDNIENVVDAGLQRGLFIIINVHHDDWIKNSYTTANKVRLDSLWSQIANRFKSKSDSLLFEILNEPQVLSLVNINDLNARVLKVIRKTNPTRIVIFSGTGYTTQNDFFAASIPDATDKYLMGYYHDYWGWPWSNGDGGTPFSTSAISSVINIFNKANTYTSTNGIPVILGEWGFSVKCEYNPRMLGFAVYAEQTYSHHVTPFVWDDGGNFGIYNRSTRIFDNDVKDIITNYYPISPNGLTVKSISDSSVQVTWINRTADNDSIIVERKLSRNSDFVFLAKISQTASSFIDFTTPKIGSFYYRIRTKVKGKTILSYPIMISVSGPPQPRSPFLENPISIPGKVEAENFDNGGEGVAYHYPSGISTEKEYRPNEGINIGTPGAGLYHLGYIENEEWTEYTLNVMHPGKYSLIASVAGGGGSGGKFNLSFRKISAVNKYLTTETFTVPGTSSWNTYTSISTTAVLDSGIQIMRMSVLSATAFNLDYIILPALTSINQNNHQAPLKLQLFDNYPNPFNPSTIISFNLPSVSFVSLKIYDVVGREISTLVSNKLIKGNYSYTWNAEGLSSGIYYYQIKTDNFTETKKMILIM